MGMRANYQQSSDEELKSLKGFVDAVEELQEKNDPELCDIDKMWDALHFLLTGKSASQPIENDPISEAIVGEFNLNEEEFVAGTSAKRVKIIAEALQKLDFEIYAKKFNMRHFAEHDIYPDIWKYDDEADEIIDELQHNFKSLKNFYRQMADKGAAVLVSIY